VGLSGHIFVVPRFPSKSGLMHKHIVKHIFVKKSVFVKHIALQTYRVKHIVKLVVELLE
jgi:hypothetical protein